MKIKIYGWALAAAWAGLGMAAGCSSTPERRGDSAGPAVRDPQPMRHGQDAQATAGVDAVPQDGTASLREAPRPIYRNPKIGVVYLRAHQDEEGRLLGPQVMYQVTEAGGWNVDAAESPASPNYAGPSPALQGYAGTSRDDPGLALSADSPLLDPIQAGQVVVTGLMEPSDRPQAEAMAEKAGAGRAAVFDDQAGWLILQR